jgi:hypothetical protein
MAKSKSRSKRKGSPYDVGYGKPPVSFRFKPGQSGNPSGRPKAPQDISELAAKELKKKRRAKIDGEFVTVSTAELLIKRLVVDAGKSSLPALKQLLALALPAQQKQLRKVIEYTEIHPGMSDKEAMDAYMAMISQPIYDE